MEECTRRFPVSNCSVLVVGLGVSGKSTLRYLRECARERHLEVYVADQAETEQTRHFLDELAFPDLQRCFAPDAVEVLAENRHYTKFDVCIISPGIPCWDDLYCQAYAYSHELISEVEFAWRESATSSRWIAITGTNGKTTTTSLCACMLQDAGYKAAAVGNIGDTCIEAVRQNKTDVYVAEVSSYQLASSLSFAPNVVVMLNITPDHIHWHQSYEKYKEAKFNLLRNIARYRDTTVIFDITNDVERTQAWAQLVKYTRIAFSKHNDAQHNDAQHNNTQYSDDGTPHSNAISLSKVCADSTLTPVVQGDWNCNDCGELEDAHAIEPPVYNASPHFVWIGSKAGLHSNAQSAYTLEKRALLKAADPAKTLLHDISESTHDVFDPCFEKMSEADLAALPFPKCTDDIDLPQLSCAYVNEHNELCETQPYTLRDALNAGTSSLDATRALNFGSVDDLHIKGEHNINNALCAASAAFALTHNTSTFGNSFTRFMPLEHRIEPCGTVAGVAFYNDSKGTNVDSTLKAITSFPNKNLIVLLGGEDKGTCIDELVACAHRFAHTVIVYGAARCRFDEAFSKKENDAPEHFCVYGAAHMRDAFTLACALAHKGDVVLLSPACASFDEFKSFEQRGTIFKQLVKQKRSELGE